MNRYAKAIVGAITTGATAYYSANADGHVTGDEWVTVAVAFIVSLAAVWGVQNAPAKVAAPASDLDADLAG